MTSLIERGSARFSEAASNALEKSGIPNATESTRQLLGTAPAVTATFALVEALALNKALIPFRFAFALPIPFVGVFNISLPDLFVLLTSGFWAPVLLWFTLSLLLPVTTGWLFNISGTQASRKFKYSVDPVVFNITKAVTLWVFYVRGWSNRDEWVDPRTSGTVDGAIVGGVPAMFLGSLIGGSVGVWEGVVRGQGR